jgi:hypothetical protein
VTESIVENDVAKGMRLISNSLRDGADRDDKGLVQRVHGRARNG